VRIAGVVVAIDEFEGRRVYTVDDGSGETIECVVKVAQPSPPGLSGIPAARPEAHAAKATATEPNQQQVPIIDGDIDVGHVLDIKGSVKLLVFRNIRQIHAEKIIHLRSTEREVQFWEKLTQLRVEILDHPWVLDRREIRRCRKEADGHDERRAKRQKTRDSSTTDRTEGQRHARSSKSIRQPLAAKSVGPVCDNILTASASSGLGKRAKPTLDKVSLASGLEKTPKPVFSSVYKSEMKPPPASGIEKTPLSMLGSTSRLAKNTISTSGLEKLPRPALASAPKLEKTAMSGLGLGKRPRPTLEGESKSVNKTVSTLGLEKQTRPVRKPIQVSGKYGALGL